ncbi:protein ELYS-like [Chelmon rostratus]|uniref:protein ELYS-like n=1 Tax=Chelmon rostratus TaxID=109905 RepID=UPI001BE598E9|nr:protein ELYS-like [Chelmon rostratus]
MVTQLHRQHRYIWTSEDCTDQCYPPPNLQALLKLVLIPHIDNMSVQALLMYFILDMANFLQCKDDLLQSFCHAFTIPSSFSQQIRAFWMLDRGHVKVSMELLLSPRAAVPWFSWQHHCIVHSLLMRKQPQLALKYLHWTRPTIESAEDAKLCADVLLQNSCVSEAWALLKRGHADSSDMVTHFLQACNRAGLCAEALKYIPAGYNSEGDNVNGKETTGPLMKKAGRPPIPLSAKLYQAQGVNRVSPEVLLQLVRTAVMEVRKPHPKISEVVWPEHTDRNSNREMCLSTQALRHLTPSPSPVGMVQETEPTETADEAEEEEPVRNQPESPEHMSSSEDDSVSSFTSASSLPLLRRDRPYVYESTLTLQRISSLLTDGESHGREEEDEEDSRTPSSTDALPDCPEVMLTLDGATDPIFFSTLNKGTLVELVLSAEEEFLGAVSGPAVDETLPVNKSEDSQSVPPLFEPQVESHSFLSPDDDFADLWHAAVSLHQEDQSNCISYESFSFSEAATSDCFLEEEPPQKTYEDHQRQDAVGCFSQGFSCAMTETTQNLLTDPHQSLLSEDPVASGTGASAGVGQEDTSLLPPVCSSICPTQLQQTSGSSVTPSQTCSIQTTSDTTNESFPKVQLKTDEPCVQSTSSHLDRCKAGSWWKQDLETCRASSGLLCAAEPGAAVTPDNKRPSLLLSQPYSNSLVNFMDFTAEQRGDNRDGKQADKEEPAGWSSLGRGSQGAIRSGRTRSRKGKRVKRT